MSDYYDNVKRAFKETLEALGDKCPTITFNGITKKCITGPIERKRDAEVSGYLPKVMTQADILDDDFKALRGIGDRSTVTIDKTAMRIMAIDSEPSDPIVHLVVISNT